MTEETPPMVDEHRTAYVVTESAYSAYSVVAVYTTREAAEAYIARARETGAGLDDPRIEEYPLDVPVSRMGAHWASIDKRGTVISSGYSPLQDPLEPASAHGGTADRWFVGYGKTVEHARRAAEELRRQTIVLGAPADGP